MKSPQKGVSNEQFGVDENEPPKLTRSKAKELNQLPLPLVSELKPDEDLVALIHGDLHLDDDDEEYQPGAEEAEVS